MKRILGSVTLSLALCAMPAIAQEQAAVPAPQQQQMQVNEWIDTFQGNDVDPAKWEKFTFEGPSGGKVEVKDGKLTMRGLGGSRFGLRTKQEFSGDRWIVEAKIPNPPTSPDMKNAWNVLTVLFDTSGRNRIEWIFRNDSHFEAWRANDGRLEELDNRRLATKETAPTIAIARRGDQLMFLLNGEVGLTKKFTDLPKDFHVMVYGTFTSENSWNSVRVVTAK